MENAKLDLLRYRNASGLLDITYRFIKQNVLLHFKSLLVFIFPLILFGFLFMDFLVSRSNTFSDENTAIIFNIINILAIIFCLVVFAALFTVSFKFVQLYIKNDSTNDLTIKNIWKESKGNLGWMMGYSCFLLLYIFLFNFFTSYIFNFIQISIGQILLFIIAPLLVFIFFGSIIFYMHAMLLKMEEPMLGFFKVLKKCLHLFKDSWWNAVGFMIIFFILLCVMIVFAMFPAIIIEAFHLIIESNSRLALWLQKIAAIISITLVFLLYSYILLAVPISFYSLYAKLTGSNLKNQIDSIGTGLDHEAIEKF